MEKFKNITETLKSIFDVLKSASIPFVVCLIILFPSRIKTILKESGINKISGMGLEINIEDLEKSQDKTTELAFYIQKTEQKIDSLSLKLKAISKTTKDTKVIKEISDLNNEISLINSDFKKVNTSLKKTMITQEQTLEDITGKTIKNNVGWFYVGKADKEWGNWIGKEKLTVNTISLADLKNSNQTISIKDDVYLRNGSIETKSFFSNLPVTKVLERGTTVTTKKIGYTKAIGGGVFVWIYINE